jgi:hypothetical protein
METIQAYINTINKFGQFEVSATVRILAGEKLIQIKTDGATHLVETEKELISYLDGLYTASVKLNAINLGA